MNELVVYATTSVIDPIAAVLFFWFLVHMTQLEKPFPIMLRLGLATCAGGLFGQVARSWIGFTTGEFPDQFAIPFWVFKDWGLALLAIHFAMEIYKTRKG